MMSALGFVSAAGADVCPEPDAARMRTSTAAPRIALPVRLILPPPRASAWSTESASDLARARWNQTTPAMCALRRRSLRRRWQPLPYPSITVRSRRWRRAALAPHCPVAHRPRAQQLGSALRDAILPPDDFQSRPLRN